MGTGAFFGPLRGSSSLRRGRSPRVLPARALFLKKRLSSQRRSAWNPCRLIPMRKAVCRVGAVRKPGRARGALSSCSRVFSAGRGRRSFARRDKIGRYFPLRSPARSLSPVLHPFSSRCKKPARQVFSDRPGWLFVLFHLLRAPPCGDAVWINAAADSAPRNRRRSPRRWAAPTRRGSCPGCACRRYVRPPCCPPPGAGRPTAPARRWR